MGKFSDLSSIVMARFATPAWVAEGIITHPSNFIGDVPGKEYIRISVLASNNPEGSMYAKLNAVSGLIMVEIYTAAGEGPLRANQIADILDKHLQGGYFLSSTGVAQLGLSVLKDQGLDKANPSLQRTLYSLSFSYFGK